jgi:hypothetical protein
MHIHSTKFNEITSVVTKGECKLKLSFFLINDHVITAYRGMEV